MTAWLGSPPAGVRLVLDAAVDSNTVLDAARAAGRVTEFAFERRRLSEVFRESLGQGSSNG